MPGIVGISSHSDEMISGEVSQALALMDYSAKSESSICLDERNVVAGMSNFSFLKLLSSTDFNETSAYVHGEVYDQSGLSDSFADQLLSHYNSKSLDKFVAKVDGYYNAILYDRRAGMLLLITDRYGLRPLYIRHKLGSLIFASELKCFQAFSRFTLQIRRDVVDSFLALEHFLGDHTWFADVRVAEPSTIYTYDIRADRLTSMRYWSWSNVRQSTSIKIDDASEEVGRLFNEAIKKRTNAQALVGISLSGGLDSRAILASMAEEKPLTFTFGIENSDDVKIAKQVAAVAGVKNVFFNLDTEDWLTARFGGVWKTDGMFNMYHMHYSQHMMHIPSIVELNMSGFLGDAVIGGSYLERNKQYFLNRRIDSTIARKYYGNFFEMSEPDQPYFDLEKIDPYLFYNRGRRMIGLGLEEAHKTIGQRLPFMDAALMDFAYSLPDELRKDSRMYNQMLLKNYPKFFTGIPWQKTGVPIEIKQSVLNRWRAGIHFWKNAVRYKLNQPVSFTNVSAWLRRPNTSAVVGTMLDPKNAIYPQFTTRNLYKEYYLPHLNGDQKKMKGLMGALTLEIWLQQILNKKFLPSYQGKS